MKNLLTSLSLFLLLLTACESEKVVSENSLPNAAKEFDNQIEIIDLRTLAPLDENRVFESVKKHNRCIVLTEEPVNNSFAQSLAARISDNCFRHLDAPVKVVGAKDLPAIPINSELEKEMLPNTQKLIIEIEQLLKY